MSSSYEFIFDVILDYSNSNIIIPTGDISNDLTINNLSEISGGLILKSSAACMVAKKSLKKRGVRDLIKLLAN